MYFFSNKILLARKLFDSKVDCLLQIYYFLFKLFYFFIEDLDGFLVLFMLFENSREFLLLDHYFIKDGSIVYKISSL